MRKRPALIATDLDGTLLRSDGTISKRTKAAIYAAQEAGVLVAFVTARPPVSIESLADQLGLTGMAVCCNGALLYDLAKRSVLRAHRFDVGLGQAIITELRDLIPGVCFAIQQGMDFHQERAFPPFWDDWHAEPMPRVDCALCLIEGGVVKVLVHHPSHDADSLAKLVGGHFGGKVQTSHSGMPIIELAPAGVTKASGL